MAAKHRKRGEHRARPRPSTARAPRPEPPVVSLVTLGCAKNLVDSERILGRLAESGFLIAQDPSMADACLVNTCGFIDEARQETASVLKELASLKTAGKPAIVALGCLVERAADASNLSSFLHGADARLGFKDYARLPEILRELLAPKAADYSAGPTESAAKKRVPKSYNDFLVAPRLRIGRPHSAYLKISEGCSNPCRFCAIPRMRGLQVSRPIEDLVQEARELAEGGAKELCLIAQDTTSYGFDLYQERCLAKLLRALSAVEEIPWLRLMYAYPRFLTAEMLDVLRDLPAFCPYLDLPLQHISDSMLTSMARLVTKKETLDLLDLIAEKLPDGALRTTFIVGYPGETEADFREMLAVIEEGRFRHAGVFLYSTEPLTPAAQLAETVPLEVKQERRDVLMAAQREVSRKRLAQRVGRPLEVLIDRPLYEDEDAPEGAEAIGRTKLEAPEVDGLVFVRGPAAHTLEPGALIRARCVEALDYDVIVEYAGG